MPKMQCRYSKEQIQIAFTNRQVKMRPSPMKPSRVSRAASKPVLGLNGFMQRPCEHLLKFHDRANTTRQKPDNMLTEHYVASIQSPLKTPAAGSKDVNIFINELQPLAGPRQAFKRSATAPHCLAVNETHIFAAQAEKSVVHVYSREKGNHEATIPFNEKVTCLALAVSGLVLLLGTESGRIMAWEVSFRHVRYQHSPS
jgi:hypothetical protein